RSVALVIRVSRRAESLCTRLVVGTAASLEGARTPRAPARADGAASAGRAGEVHSSGSGAVCRAEPSGTATGVGVAAGQTRDRAALAPPAGRARRDLSAPGAGPATAEAIAARGDPASRPRKSALGIQRIVGELKGLGISVSATSVRKALLEAGLAPAPERGRSSWRAFLRAQAASMLACDFLTVGTAFLQRI